MPHADFEVRQLLKAYRKGVISDALFRGTDGGTVQRRSSHLYL